MSSDRVLRWFLVAAAVFAAIAAVSVVGRFVVDAATNRFTVEFETPGSSCEWDEDTLFLDRTTGEELACSRAPVAARPGTERPDFRSAIAERANALAQDGSLSGSEQREIQRYADALAVEEGYDPSGFTGLEIALRVTLGAGCLLALLCLAVGGAYDYLRGP